MAAYTKEQALAEIEETKKNIEEVKEARREAWDTGRRDVYQKLTKDIRELNDSIKALEAYL